MKTFKMWATVILLAAVVVVWVKAVNKLYPVNQQAWGINTVDNQDGVRR